MALVTLKVALYVGERKVEGAEAKNLFIAYCHWDGRVPYPVSGLRDPPHVQTSIVSRPKSPGVWMRAVYCDKYNFSPRDAAQSSLLAVIAQSLTAMSGPLHRDRAQHLQLAAEANAVLNLWAGRDRTRMAPEELMRQLSSYEIHVEAGLLAGVLEVDSARHTAELTVEV